MLLVWSSTCLWVHPFSMTSWTLLTMSTWKVEKKSVPGQRTEVRARQDSAAGFSIGQYVVNQLSCLPLKQLPCTWSQGSSSTALLAWWWHHTGEGDGTEQEEPGHWRVKDDIAAGQVQAAKFYSFTPFFPPKTHRIFWYSARGWCQDPCLLERQMLRAMNSATGWHGKAENTALQKVVKISILWPTSANN